MTFFDAAKVMGKRPCVIVQLHMSRCAHQFGVAPCAAVGTGNTKCFRTRSTCRDAANYSETDLWVYNFSTTRVTGFQADDQSPVFPTVTGVNTAPTVLNPGKGLGSRASVKITIQDHPWTDVYSDPYRLERTGLSADVVGTFWGKFLARNRYHENRRITIHTGFLTDDNVYVAGNFSTRTYFITSISGPDGNGQVSLEAKDPIKFTDNNKSQFPPAYSLKLSTALATGDTSVVVQDLAGQLASAGPIVLGTQPYIRIDNEIMKVTNVTPAIPGVGVSGASYTLTVTRGTTAGTMPSYYELSTNIAATHSVGATIQPCYEWVNVNASDIIYELFIASGVDPAYMEAAATWQADFVASGLGDYKFTTLIAKNEGIKNLLDEIAQHNILIWWDERAQLIKCRALVYRSALNTIAFNERDNIIEKSDGITENAKERITQVWLSYQVLNPTFDLKKQVSYGTIDITADLSLQTPEKYGNTAITQIFSRWLQNSFSIAPQVSARQLQRYSDTYHIITFSVDPKDSSYWVGNNVRVVSSLYQDEFGVAKVVNYLLTQADEVVTSAGIAYKYTAVEQVTYSGITGMITFDPGAVIPGGYPVAGEVMPGDFSTANTAIRDAYVFLGYASGVFPDNTPSYVLV